MTATTTHRPDHPSSWRWWRRRSELGFAIGILAIAVFMTTQTIGMPGSEDSGTPGPAFFPWLITAFLYITGTMLTVKVIRNPRDREPGAAGSAYSTDMLEDLGGIDDTGEMRIVRAARNRGSSAVNATTVGASGHGEGSTSESEVDAPANSSGVVGAATSPTTESAEYIPVDYRTVGIVLAGLVGFTLLLQPVGWLLISAALFWVICWALGSKRPVFDIAVAVIFASAIQIAFSAGLGLNLPAGIMEGLLPWSN